MFKKLDQKKVWTIKRSLVYPYFVAVILSVVVVLISIYRGDPGLKTTLLVALFLPFYYLFLELISRKFTIRSDAIIIRKFLRNRRFATDDIEMVNLFNIKRKIFIIMESKGEITTNHAKHRIILSNSYGRFNEMAREISEVVGEDRLADDFKIPSESDSLRVSDTLSVWVAIITFIIVIIVRLSV